MDFTNLSKEEIRAIMGAASEGAKRFLDDFNTIKGVYKEIYDNSRITPEIIAYTLEVSRGNTTIEQAVNSYRTYLQDKKGLEEKIMDSLGLPEYVKIGDGAKNWVLDYSEIIDENGERDMVIKYKLEC